MHSRIGLVWAKISTTADRIREENRIRNIIRREELDEDERNRIREENRLRQLSEMC